MDSKTADTCRFALTDVNFGEPISISKDVSKSLILASQENFSVLALGGPIEEQVTKTSCALSDAILRVKLSVHILADNC
jgi:hypothetical protein